MARKRAFAAIRGDNENGIHAVPDARTVARINDEYGAEAAAERWAYVSASTLKKLVSEGRKLRAADHNNEHLGSK